MWHNPRYVNDVGGILVTQDDGFDLFVDPTDEAYAQLIAGVYGTIATYTPPVDQTPEEILQMRRTSASVSRMEFMLALDGAGLLDAAAALVADPATPRRIRLMWDNASSFDRLYPDLVQMAAVMGLTDAQVDAVFGL